MKKNWILIILGLAFVASRPSFADDNRMQKRFGIYAGFLSDPLLSLGEINAAYNLNDFIRLNGGLGFLISDTTKTAYYPDGTSTTTDTGTATGYSLGVGIKVLVPHWEFSPTIGLNLSESVYHFSSGAAALFFQGANTTSLDLAFLCPNFGFDYQAKDGFDIGVEINVPIILETSTDVIFNAPFIPGLNIGKFF